MSSVQIDERDQVKVSEEIARLKAVYSVGLLDTERETEFDELVQLAAAICGTPMSGITLLDERRQWFKAEEGIGVTETPREFAFCDYTIRSKKLFVVEDARADTRFAANPLVIGDPHVQFYAGMPLTTREGFALGALCVIDREPRKLSRQQKQALEVLARQVIGRIELRIQQKATAEAIAEKDRLAQGLKEQQAELEAANDRLMSLVLTDTLTGLKNRRAFDERLRIEFSMARRKRRNLSVVLLDADDFKIVNDSFGHPAGDAVLQRIAKVIMETVRETDLAARYGGEEFAVILPESGEREARRWCCRLQKALAAVSWEHIPVTLSIGIAVRVPECSSGAELVEKADQALYLAKTNGKNRIEGPGEAYACSEAAMVVGTA